MGLLVSASAANPTGTVGLTAVNGTLSTYMRADAAPVLSQSIVPTWTQAHTFNGGMTIGGAWIATGGISLTGNAASSFSTTSSTLTVDATTTVGIGQSTATSVVVGRSGQTISFSGQVLEGGTVAGTAGVTQRIVKVLSSMTNNAATNLFVITVPNITCGAGLKITITGILGDGDSTGTVVYTISISRILDAASKINIATQAIPSATVGVTAIADVSITNTAVSGANNAAQTFQVRAIVNRSAGTSTNHWSVTEAECIPTVSSGVTIA